MSVRAGKRPQRGKDDKNAKVDSASTDANDDVVKDIIKGRTDEQERIQQKVFAKWINSRFAKVNNPRRIEDLFQDLRTGVNLAALVELITGAKVVVEKGKTRLHYVCNITKALEVLEQHEIKLVNVSADDIEDGNSKLTLSLTWAIIQQYYVKRLGGTVSDLRINNLEKTLLCWVQLATKGYPHVDVKNLNTSWADGLAFNALIHKYRDDLFDYSALLSNTAEVNLAHAFAIASQKLDVPHLLEPEDVLQGTPDQKSIVTYLLCLLEALPHEAMEVKALTAVSDLESTVGGGSGSDADGNYQASAEKVLSWMLSVEEKLDRCEISDTLDQANLLWREHEALLTELSVQKNTVQLILDHGAKLLQKLRTKSKEGNSVENTMTVLTEKWENLQIKSAERSKLLRKILTILQQEHVKTINTWLIDTEERITLLKHNTNSIESMDAQLRELSKLQDDLEKQLQVMNELMHLLFVGENGDDEGVESELLSFRRRWDDICHWTEGQWTFIQGIRDTYNVFLQLCNECSDWITNRIDLLQGLPTVADDKEDWIRHNLHFLKEMHDEMLNHQEKIQSLQEKADALLAYFTPQTAVGMSVRRREEKICAEWNELVDLLEVWTTDTNVRFEKSDALRSGKSRHSKRDFDTVNSTTVSQATLKDNQNDQTDHQNDQRKTKILRQNEADEGLLENCNNLVEWLREKQKALGMDVEVGVGVDGEGGQGGQSKSSPVLDSSLLAQVSQELSGKDAEYKSLRMLAEDIIMEKRTANAPFEEIENKLNELASLWNNLTWTVGAGSTSPMLNQDEEDFTHNLEVLEDVLISCRKTVERFDHDREPSPAQLEQDLDDCKDRIHLMTINEVRITETAALVKKISDEGMAMNDIEIPWIELRSRWNQTRARLDELEANFTMMKENQPVRLFLAEIDALKVWTNQLHKQLMEEHSLHPTYLDRMTEQLQHYQDIQEAVKQRQPSLERANAPPKQLVEKLLGTNYQNELIDLNAEWRDILQYLQHNSDDLNKWCEDLKAFEIDTEGLKHWMVDVDSFLNIDIETVEDPKAFAALEEQFQGLEEDIKVLAPTTEKLLEAGRSFLKTDQEDFVFSVRDSLKEIEVQWDSICTRAARQLQRLSDTAAARREKTPTVQPYVQNSTVQSYVQGSTVQPYVPNSTVQSYVQGSTVQSYVQSSAGSGGQFSSQVEELYKIRAALPDVSRMDSLESLEKAKADVQRTRLLIQNSRSSLAETLKNGHSGQHSADHRNLEGTLQGTHQGTLQGTLREVENDCDTKEMFLRDVSDKWATLSGGISECHVWMDEVEKLLESLGKAEDETSRRRFLTKLNDFMSTQDSDKYATIAELAEEFDRNHILVPLVKSEVNRMRNRLSGLSKRVSEQQSITARSDSRTSDISDAPSGETTNSSAFLNNLDRVTGLLSDLQAKLPTIELKTFDSTVIKGQLDECVLLYKKLSEIKGEVESLIRQGREMVEREPAGPESDSLSRRLDAMKAQYNQMPAQVTATKGDLDNGLKLVKKAEKEVDSIRMAMDEMDAALAELDRLGDVAEFEDALKDLKAMVREREDTVESLRASHKQMRELAMKTNVPGFELKYSQQMQRWQKMQARLRTLKSPDQKENIPPVSSQTIVSVTETSARHALAAARSEFFGQTVTTTEGKNVIQSTATVTTTVTTHTTASSTASASSISGLREDLQQSSQTVVRQEVDGTEDSNLEKTGNRQRLKTMLQKFDAESTRIEEGTRKLTQTAPSARDVEKRLADLEALKNDALLNEALHADILKELDVTGNMAPADDTIHPQEMKNELTRRWSTISQRLEKAELNIDTVQAFYKLLSEDFLIWLPKAESIATHLTDEDALESDPRFKRLMEERDSRISVYDAIQNEGRGILTTVYKTSDGSVLDAQLTTVSQRWRDLNGKINTIREKSRVPHASEDVESYLVKLDECIKWVKRKKEVLTTMHPSGDRAILQKLHNYHHLFRAQMEAEKPNIDDILRRGRELTSPTSAEHRKTQNFDMVELSEKVKMLSDSWQSLFMESDSLQQRTESVTTELDSLLKLCESARLKSEELRTESGKWEHTDDVAVDDIAKKVEETKKFRSKVDAQGVRLEEVNTMAARLQRTPGLSEEVVRSVSHLNEEKQALAEKVNDRLSQLQAALNDVTSSDNQHFLATSVDEPWERRVGPNKVPYYINHTKQITQWDHPRLTDIMTSLLEVNKIRFSAYRTATKLRVMQKKLHLELLQLPTAIEIFDKCGLRAQNDNTLDCTQAVTCLMVIYDRLNSQDPNRINFALAIDVCLNWLLNCHDPERTGQLRVLAFKVSIVVLCQGELNAKYRYLFRLISDENGHADQQRVGQLLYSFLQIPRYLGEVAAFGGTDVEPSVMSCFQFVCRLKSTNGIDIQAKAFLMWLSKEPQALAWFSVLHRLIAAEVSRHHAKCNICECFPINGLRYRCLKCFNFDMCQNCFFTGQKSKNHKLSHPMQEYSFPATSSEDMRDFKRVLKNKLRPRDSFRNASNLGYLPVQTGSGRGVDHDKSATLTSLNSNATKGSVGSSDPADFTQTRIIEFEGSRGASSPEGDDEHNLIARYCGTLNGTVDSTQSTVEVLQAVEQEEKAEMENYLRQLQNDHDRLILELEGVKQLHDDMSSEDMVAEASMLREDKGRLEARMKILEEHNRQLDSQLQRIKHLLDEAPGRGTSSSPVNPYYTNGMSTTSSSVIKQTALRQQSNYSVGQLFHAAEGLNVAVGSLVTVMTEEERNTQQKDGISNGDHKFSGKTDLPA